MFLPELYFSRKLLASVEEARALHLSNLENFRLIGDDKNIAVTLAQEVGYLKALRDVTQWMEDAENALTKPEKNQEGR